LSASLLFFPQRAGVMMPRCARRACRRDDSVRAPYPAAGLCRPA